MQQTPRSLAARRSAPAGARKVVHVCRSAGTSVLTQTRPPATLVEAAAPLPVPYGTDEPARIDVEAIHKRLEARARAMIALDEQEVPTRTKVKFTLAMKVGLGESWKIVGKCPELGMFLPEVAPYMQWNTGDVWTLEVPIRAGTFTYKALLKKADGAYVWEQGEDRVLQVPYSGKLDVKIDKVQFPA